MGHFLLGKFVQRAWEVSEVQRLNRFDAEGDLVNDANETMAGADLLQEVGVAVLRSFGQVAGRRDPLDPGDVGIELAKLDAVQRILAMASGGGAERHVADLDVRHELESMGPESLGGLDHLEAGLGGEGPVGRVDLDDLSHAGHAEDGAFRGSTGSEGVITSHRAHGAWVACGIAQHGLDFLDGLRVNELLGCGGNAAVVV